MFFLNILLSLGHIISLSYDLDKGYILRDMLNICDTVFSSWSFCHEIHSEDPSKLLQAFPCCIAQRCNLTSSGESTKPDK